MEIQGGEYTVIIKVIDEKFNIAHILDGEDNKNTSNIELVFTFDEVKPYTEEDRYLVRKYNNKSDQESKCWEGTDLLTYFDINVASSVVHLTEVLKPNISPGFYNGELEAFEVVGNRITVAPEYRGKEYEVRYTIHLKNYENQKESFIIKWTEPSIDPLVFDNNINTTITNLANRTIPFQLKRFYSHTMQSVVDNLKYIVNIPTPIGNAKEYSYTLDDVNQILYIHGDTRGLTYNINITAYDSNFDYPEGIMMVMEI